MSETNIGPEFGSDSRSPEPSSGYRQDYRKEPKRERFSDMAGSFRKGIFLIVMLLLLVATFQLYFYIEQIINTWFEYQYAMIFKAVYYLFVVLMSLYVIRLYIVKR